MFHTNSRAILLPIIIALAGCRTPMTPSGNSLQITSVSPSSVSTTGGTPVTISGNGFGSDAEVTVGGVPAVDVVARNANTVTAVTAPVSAVGPADLTVRSNGLTATLTSAFRIVAPSGANQPPVIGAIRSVGSRVNQPSGFVDRGESVSLVASVTDDETAADRLSYRWSGSGDFSGTGTTVTWLAPTLVGSMPVSATVSLEVTESY